MNTVMQNKAINIIDVRTMMEFAEGHIPGAINIPLDQLPHRHTEIEGLGTKPTWFYCRSGNRSGQAVMYLSQLGIGQVFNGGSIQQFIHQLN